MPSDEMVEKACAAYWESYRDAWRPFGLLTATQDVPFAKLMPNVRELTADAMRAALSAALTAETEPVAWQARMSDPTMGTGEWQDVSRERAEVLKSAPCIEVRALYATPPSPPSRDDVIEDARRYRWLRDGNAYSPEENQITGGAALDELCDQGMVEAG